MLLPSFPPWLGVSQGKVQLLQDILWWPKVSFTETAPKGREVAGFGSLAGCMQLPAAPCCVEGVLSCGPVYIHASLKRCILLGEWA